MKLFWFCDLGLQVLIITHFAIFFWISHFKTAQNLFFSKTRNKITYNFKKMKTWDLILTLNLSTQVVNYLIITQLEKRETLRKMPHILKECTKWDSFLISSQISKCFIGRHTLQKIWTTMRLLLELSEHAAAKRFGVPRATLNDRTIN